jgi:drug/metabolite transporter (DMT)-like permease
MPPRLGALVAIVFWGISFVATKAVLREVSPVTLIFTRFGLGTALLAALVAARGGAPRLARGVWANLALMGFVGVFVHQLLQSYALTLTTAVRTGWLIGLIPIWSALIAAVFRREPMGGTRVPGLMLGFAGALLVVTRGRLAPGLLALPGTRGDLLILASTLNWAIYTNLGHGTLRRIGSLRATAGAMLIGWLMLGVPFTLAHGWRELARLSPVGIGAVAFLGLGCSGLAYLLWYGALERVETARVAAFLYLEPLVTLAAAVAWLGEPVGVMTVIGGLTVLAGVALVQRAPARPRPAREVDG